jgi:thioredoxin reductase
MMEKSIVSMCCTGALASTQVRDETGNIVTDTHGRSSADNLYAAGDVVRALDQISVAVGYLAISASGLAKMQLFHRIHREQAAGCCG